VIPTTGFSIVGFDICLDAHSMFRLQDISIRRKLTLIVMVASTVALLFVSGGFVAYELVTFRGVMTSDLATQAEIVGNQSAAALIYDDPSTAEEILGALRAKKHVMAAGLYRNGRLFARYARHPGAEDIFPPSPGPDGARFEPNRLVLFREVHLEGESVGVVYLRSDLREMDERLARYGVIILLFLAASLAVTFLLSSFLQRIISRPILQLAGTARAVAVEKNYTVRAAKHGADELGQLIDGFNEMLTQIQERDAALQQANDQLEKRVQERTDDLQQQLARISLLNRITQVISERHDTESILHVVLRQLEDHLCLDLGSVALFDPTAGALNVAALRLKNPRLSAKLDLHEGTALTLNDAGLQLCQEGQTIYVPDTLKRPAELMEKLAGAGLRSAVAVPLLVEHRLFGVLLGARLRADGFSSNDCEFLRTLSEHMALAAHQARLYSELEHAYNELRQTQQSVMQQERLKALGQMASGIAHDVNNALSPVIGFADLLLQNEHALTGNGKKYLKHIRTAGDDIAHIVARLREFYRRRGDHDALQELNLNDLAEQVVDMTRPRWRDIPQSNGITIETRTDLAPDLPSMVGNDSEIREALTNLVLNAVDALPQGGNISVRTRASRCDPTADDKSQPSHIVVEVGDNGVGMNEETRKRCLEPFFSTKGSRGTGMGLSMVYGVVERHEGSIEIQSEPGKGSLFRLIFPARKMAAIRAKAERKLLALPSLRILYIDDEPLLRELLRELLQRDGHKVEVHDNGQSGIDAFRRARQRGHPFDVAISDLGMPYLDGRQVAKILKSESPATPVILLTGWGTIMREDGALPDEVDGVLSKPPRSRELRETLCRVTRARAAPSP
jgi:signal transduction histidine kinase/ActR/RegA family two-component response regulator